MILTGLVRLTVAILTILWESTELLCEWYMAYRIALVCVLAP